MKIKSLIFSLGLLTLANSPLHAMKYHDNHLITSQPKATIAGGVLGVSLGMAAHLYKNYSKTKSLWQNIKSCPWYYLVVPGAISAAGAGYIASFYTPKAYYKSAWQELDQLCEDINLNIPKQKTYEDGLQVAMMASPCSNTCPTTFGSFQDRLKKIAGHFDVVRQHSDDPILPAFASLGMLRLLDVAQIMQEKITDSSDLVKCKR